MEKKIYCPDIECDSCVKILNRIFKKLQGIQEYHIKKDHITVSIDESLIQIEHIIQAIKDKGYRASLEPYTRKNMKERAKEFLKDRKKYEIEYRMLKNIGATFIIFLLANAGLIFYKLQQEPLFFANYGWWIFYTTISVVSLGGALWHFKAYKTQYTCMVGMMVGMTIGMQTGMMIGAILGATNGFFIGALTGMLLASAVGAYTGSCCGIMGVMEGIMAGIMGGTMGSMIAVMMFNDNIFWFMPPFMILNIIILIGLSYMIFEEVVEDNEHIIKKPMSFAKFFLWCTLALVVTESIMLLAPVSIFLA